MRKHTRQVPSARERLRYDMDDPLITPAAIARRELILERAAALFDESGYAATSMVDIAASVGIRKPSLYHYFTTKSEILVSIHSAFIDELTASQEKRLSKELDGESLVRELIVEIIDLIRNKRGWVRTFFEHYRELPPEARVDADAKRDRYRGLVQRAFTEAGARGELAELDPDIAVRSILGMATWAYHWYGAEDTRSPAEIADAMTALVLVGLRPRNKA